ncbi:hypothetical protein DIPPA_65950 [Diplonema papillatum]|nr:hypothetical protein DIPPA_56692 [Diplonema papillatum]KAJ9441595.1 hypothetical protein DIPPA_65950 [Diplonema papillatum]
MPHSRLGAKGSSSSDVKISTCSNTVATRLLGDEVFSAVDALNRRCGSFTKTELLESLAKEKHGATVLFQSIEAVSDTDCVNPAIWQSWVERMRTADGEEEAMKKLAWVRDRLKQPTQSPLWRPLPALETGQAAYVFTQLQRFGLRHGLEAVLKQFPKNVAASLTDVAPASDLSALTLDIWLDWLPTLGKSLLEFLAQAQAASTKLEDSASDDDINDDSCESATDLTTTYTFHSRLEVL